MPKFHSKKLKIFDLLFIHQILNEKKFLRGKILLLLLIKMLSDHSAHRYLFNNTYLPEISKSSLETYK